MRRDLVAVSIAGIVLALSADAWSAVNGGGGGGSLDETYRGKASGIEAQAIVDPQVFVLAEMAQPWIAIPLILRYRGDKPIALEGDEVSMVWHGPATEKLDGTFDLAKVDPKLWRKISQDLRDKIAYPLEIEAASSGQDRLIKVFAFFKTGKHTSLPDEIEYRIKALGGEPIVLTRSRPKAR